MNKPVTSGVHHVGLAVSQLEESASFFTDLLGWEEVRRNEEYPAIFVSDGKNMITLWKTNEEMTEEFDKNKNVGLHHIAFNVESEEVLNNIHKVMIHSGIIIEFSPEFLRQGPAKHMMCYEPSGIRVEFIWPGN
ncbi:MAG: VOC family protein [Gammaproteobacteria bacterium]|nr:VOC family protein [Gammaproteobacteria bacterium]